MLYPRAMGAAFADLPEALQRFHAVEDTVLYRGQVEVRHGGPLGRALARAEGMPTRAGKMPFRFRATRDGDGEIWERDFDGHLTRSTQWLKAPGVIEEQVGTSRFEMVPQVREDRLHIPITAVSGFGLPVPMALMRECKGVEAVDAEGRITFDVQARVWGIGLVIRYRGVLDRVEEGRG